MVSLRAARPLTLATHLALGIVAPATACTSASTTDARDETSSGGEDGTTGVPGSASTSLPPGGDTTMAADGSSPTTAPPSDDSSDGSGSEGGFIPNPDMGGPGDPLPLGEGCEADDDCASGFCFTIGDFGGGLCSECAHDSDCMRDGGAGTCGFAAQPWAVCTAGEAGAICESSEGCADAQVCAPIFEANPFSFCGACASDDDCDPGSACGPTFDMGNVCVLPGTLDLDEACPVGSDASCIWGHCTDAPYMDTPIGLSLCGECGSDDDCDVGETCMPAFISDDDLGGTVCM